jgi:hypothetical protein
MADFLVTMDRAGRDCHGSHSRYRLDRDGMEEVNDAPLFLFCP